MKITFYENVLITTFKVYVHFDKSFVFIPRNVTKLDSSFDLWLTNVVVIQAFHNDSYQVLLRYSL